MADRVGETEVLVSDSVTLVPVGGSGHVLVCGSHGGVNSALFAAAAGLKGVAFNDAGVGKESAGIAGLLLLEQYAIAAAAVDFESARIGDGFDTYHSGRISHVNSYGRDSGVRVGMDVRSASRLMAAWRGASARERPAKPTPLPPTVVGMLRPRIVLADSIAQINEAHVGDVVISGSHGGVVAGRSVKVAVGAAIFNDAGVGKDRAGLTRLPMLQEQGIPAATVTHLSARIGDALDAYEAGRISHVNGLAGEAGVTVGESARASAERFMTWLRDASKSAQQRPNLADRRQEPS